MTANDIRCRCGARGYDTIEDARRAEPSGIYKCPDCHTFATDHSYMDTGYDGDGRCGDCDTRVGSHR